MTIGFRFDPHERLMVLKTLKTMTTRSLIFWDPEGSSERHPELLDAVQKPPKPRPRPRAAKERLSLSNRRRLLTRLPGSTPQSKKKAGFNQKLLCVGLNHQFHPLRRAQGVSGPNCLSGRRGRTRQRTLVLTPPRHNRPETRHGMFAAFCNMEHVAAGAKKKLRQGKAQGCEDREGVKVGVCCA